jgi:hypothetical protein
VKEPAEEAIICFVKSLTLGTGSSHFRKKETQKRKKRNRIKGKLYLSAILLS